MQNKLLMQAFVVDLLKQNISAFYFYHNYEHTLYVANQSLIIGKKENCTEKELDLVHCAALWHDTGFIRTYAGHEEQSCELAQEYLPGYGYSADDIRVICGMIMATKIPQTPTTKLEEIVADADLEYLATPDAAEKAEQLFREWNHLDHSLTREEWNRRQIAFLRSHHYFTPFCQNEKAKLKSDYLQRLVDLAP